ncbi:MAG: family 16 glycoside hydrolase [Planctomycetota bacterium]
MIFAKRISRLAVFSCLIFILGLAIRAQIERYGEDPPDKEWLKLKSNQQHYLLRTTGTEADGRKFLERMELTFDALSKLLNWSGALGKPFEIKMYKNRRQFIKGGAPPSAGAFYSPQERYLCGYFSKNKEKIYNYMSHEGVHQFHHMVFGRPYEEIEGVPRWYDEGIADCMGNSEVKSGKFRMCLHKGPIALGRLPTIQRAIKNKKYYPLKELMKMNKQDFYRNGGLCYAEAWSFVHFLLACPKKEDKTKPYPAGDYFYIMGRLFNGFMEYTQFNSGKKKDSQFKTLDDVYNYAFVSKDGKTPLNIDEIEEKWKAYVLKFHYRDGADGVKDEEADMLLDRTTTLFKEGKWTEAKQGLDELKGKYNGTMPVTENTNDLNQMLRICELKGKETSTAPVAMDIKLFNGKDINNWEQDDDDEEAGGWAVKDSAINCASESAMIRYKEPTCLDYTISIIFKFQGKVGPDKGSMFTVCKMNEDYNFVGAGIDASGKKVHTLGTYRDYRTIPGYGSILIQVIKPWDDESLEKVDYKENDWNTLKFTVSGTEISASCNGMEIGSHSMTDEEIEKIGIDKRGRIVLLLQDGKVQIKDVTMSYGSGSNGKTEDKPEKE